VTPPGRFSSSGLHDFPKKRDLLFARSSSSSVNDQPRTRHRKKVPDISRVSGFRSPLSMTILFLRENPPFKSDVFGSPKLNKTLLGGADFVGFLLFDPYSWTFSPTVFFLGITATLFSADFLRLEVYPPFSQNTFFPDIRFTTPEVFRD